MSIERNLERTANALEAILEMMKLQAGGNVPVGSANMTQGTISGNAPVTPQNPIPAPVAPAMNIPVFNPAPAAPAPVAPGIPTIGITRDEMIKRVTAKYAALGAEKGAQIQGVLAQYGVASLSTVPEAVMAEFVARIEALQ